MIAEKIKIVDTSRGYLTLHQCFEGIHVFGANGGGKSSAMKFTALNLLRSGLGGVVLCDKPEEAGDWLEYGKKVGRSNDMLLLSEHRFNFLEYEASRDNSNTESIVSIITELDSVQNEDIWIKAAKQLLRNCVDLLLQSEENLSLPNILKIITTAPKSLEDVAKVQDSWVGQMLCKAEDNQHYDFEIMSDYWLSDFPQLNDRTRTSITQTLSTLIDKLARGTIGQIFNTDTTFCFEDLRRGKILICNLSNKEFGEAGRYCNIIVKYMFQKMSERVKTDIQPAFIWADEAQFFISENDSSFMTTARSSKVVNVYLSQNIHNYKKALGGTGKADASVKAMLGLFQTKFFFQNSDIETNRYGAELIGKKLYQRYSESHNSGGNRSLSKTSNYSEQKDFEIEPTDFGNLYKGGTDFNFQVSCVIFNSAIKNRYLIQKIDQRTGRTVLADIKETQTTGGNNSWIASSTFLCYIIVIICFVALLFTHPHMLSR